MSWKCTVLDSPLPHYHMGSLHIEQRSQSTYTQLHIKGILLLRGPASAFKIVHLYSNAKVGAGVQDSASHSTLCMRSNALRLVVGGCMC